MSNTNKKVEHQHAFDEKYFGRARFQGGITYGDILSLFKKKGVIIKRRSPFMPREKIYKVWENRKRAGINEFLERLSAYPKTPTFSPETPISLTEFIIHTLEHLTMFYLLYLMMIIVSTRYELFPLTAPIDGIDTPEDYGDTHDFKENKLDFEYESSVLVYLGVFICGIISCYCLSYYYMRPDWNSLRAIGWTAFDLEFLKKGPHGYDYKYGIHGKASPRLEIFYKVWWQYYCGHTYSDHCYGNTYYSFPVKRRYIPGFKRSYYWRKRVMFYTHVIIWDIRAIGSRRNAGGKKHPVREALKRRLIGRLNSCQEARDWLAVDFPNMYVRNPREDIYRKKNGYVKYQRSKRFREWKKKRHVF